MIDRDGDLLSWECMYNYDGATNRAISRLEEIAASEAILGYDESAKLYRDTSAELKEARTWFHETFQEAVKAVESVDD